MGETIIEYNSIECEGCSNYIKHPSANCVELNTEGNCPCMVCIVKMVCEVDNGNECSAWDNWYVKQQTKWRENIHA